MPNFLTYEQQVTKLEQLGIVAASTSDVIPAIKFHGYDKIVTDYIKTLTETETNIPFRTVESLVLFDFDLQTLLFKYIIQSETTLKTLFSHKIGHKFGIKKSEYLNHNKYQNPKPVERRIEFINNKFVKRKSFSKDPFAKYTDEENIPPWLYFSQVDLGDFINFYSEIDIDIKQDIAKDLITQKKAMLISDKNELVISSIKFMHSFRNKIAHGQHCFSFNTNKNIKFDNIAALASSEVISSTEYSKLNERIYILLLLVIIINPYKLIRDNFISDINILYDSYHNKFGNEFIQYFHSVSGIPTDYKYRLDVLNRSLW
ncbi:Abi family protein [Macrococcus brunensis]|nr:Abi family protein [Macrococcus brunensis]